MESPGKATLAGGPEACGHQDDLVLRAGVNGSSQPDPGPSHGAVASAPPRIVSIRPAWGVSQRALPPGPRLPTSLQRLAFWYNREAFFERCRARYGSRFTFRLRMPAPVPMVSLSSPDDIKEMFLAPPGVLYAGDGSAELEKYFGQTGLAFMEEDEHLARRRLLIRSAHGEAVQRMAASLAEVVEGEVASWPRDKVFRLHPHALRLAVKAMRLVSFGTQQDERLDELVDVHLEMMRFSTSPMSHVLLHTLPPGVLRVLGAIRPLGFHRFFKLRARADRLIADVVEDRRGAGGEGDDIVSLLLSVKHEDGSPLTWVELRDEIMTTFVAGSESTAGTITFAIERLAHDPGLRERLLDEIAAEGGDPYMTATVQEILRLKPIVPVIPRQVMKPIEIGGQHYQPGVRLWANAYLLHTDPSVYPDPYVFRPERFLENGPGTYTWIPFGGGRRRCLGNIVAQHEIKCVLREVLTRYDVRAEGSPSERPNSRAVVYLPAGGLRVALSERSRQPAVVAPV